MINMIETVMKMNKLMRIINMTTLMTTTNNSFSKISIRIWNIIYRTNYSLFKIMNEKIMKIIMCKSQKQTKKFLKNNCK
jgi:hypothetical protein